MNQIQRPGENVQIETTDDKIIITIDRHVRLGPSASGKTTGVASTRGNVKVTADGIYLGLNAYIYIQPKGQEEL
jgi:hypothetical protein